MLRRLFFLELLPTDKEKKEGFCLRVLVIRHRRSTKKKRRGEKRKRANIRNEKDVNVENHSSIEKKINEHSSIATR